MGSDQSATWVRIWGEAARINDTGTQYSTTKVTVCVQRGVNGDIVRSQTHIVIIVHYIICVRTTCISTSFSAAYSVSAKCVDRWMGRADRWVV